MNPNLSAKALRLVVINSNQLPRTLLSNCLQQRYPQYEICDVAGVDSALRLVDSTPRRLKKPFKTLFVIGYFSYMRQLDIVQKIKVSCPNSRIVLLDRYLKYGCSFVIHRFHIHGYVTIFDPLETFLTCIERVAEDKAFHSPDAACFLRCDLNKKMLLCHENLCQKVPFSLSESEWLCFQYLLTDRDLNELADLFALKPRSIRNMKYRIMNKFRVKNMTEMIRLAHQWGFLDD